ncbi:hypothetical protein [Nocardioides sp. CFH 31398]|uniref:hypothetical protein n=1 Tax=Nocardioides sp. CFH 31398 TaxID=2919579 RepID=UPI001F060129|nr:hypothetical protein [Nocardioides sp. CFH 31398]MCH1864985.1 hypothetical protein [Nocardioides sp. CFH 31398]
MSTAAHLDGATGAVARPAPSRAQRAGLVVGGLFCALMAVPMSPPDGETGPPLAIIVLVCALGVVGLVAAVLAWRTRAPVWRRVLAGVLLVNAVSALPAFFVPGVPLLFVVYGAVTEVLTVLVVVLLFSGRRR